MSRNKREGKYAGKARNYEGVMKSLGYGKVKHFRVGSTYYSSLKETAKFYKRMGL